MKMLFAKRPGGGTMDHLPNARDHDSRVVTDLAGDVMMILPDLVCNVSTSARFAERATFRAGAF